MNTLLEEGRPSGSEKKRFLNKDSVLCDKDTMLGNCETCDARSQS